MSIVIPPPPDFHNHEEEVPEFNSGTPSRTWYHYLLIVASLVFAAVSVGFIGTIVWNSLPDFAHHAGTLLGGDGWQSPTGPFGGLAMIVGTVETSLVALVVAVIVGLGTSISIVFLIPRRFRNIVATLVELLAAVPSVVYGLWGFLVLAPWMLKTVIPWLDSWPFAREIFGNPGQQDGQSLSAGVDRALGHDPADVRGDQSRGYLRRPPRPRGGQPLARRHALAGDP